MTRLTQVFVGVVIAVALVGALAKFGVPGFSTLIGKLGPSETRTEAPASADSHSAAIPQRKARPRRRPSAAKKAMRRERPATAADGPAAIVSSVYSFLRRPGGEAADYGLYSYVLFPSHSVRVDAFIEALFARTGWSGDSRIHPANLNMIYLPVFADLESRLGIRQWDPLHPHPDFAVKGYAYPEARRLLAQICLRPAEGLYALCASDLARGPYLFTSSKPASSLDALPPPYLVLDLSDVRPRAFPNFIAAYKEQVKRTDFTDRERIDAFNLELLNITLAAADVVPSVVKSVKDLVSLVKD